MAKTGKKSLRIAQLENQLAQALEEIRDLKQQLGERPIEPQESQFLEQVKDFWDSMKEPK